MTRSRMTLSVDEANKIFTLRYIGSIDGEEVNESVLQQLAQMTAPWEYDTVVDQRRHEGTILTAEIEELGQRWSQFAQGRDTGKLIAVVTAATPARNCRRVVRRCTHDSNRRRRCC